MVPGRPPLGYPGETTCVLEIAEAEPPANNGWMMVQSKRKQVRFKTKVETVHVSGIPKSKVETLNVSIATWTTFRNKLRNKGAKQ